MQVTSAGRTQMQASFGNLFVKTKAPGALERASPRRALTTAPQAWPRPGTRPSRITTRRWGALRRSDRTFARAPLWGCPRCRRHPSLYCTVLPWLCAGATAPPRGPRACLPVRLRVSHCLGCITCRCSPMSSDRAAPAVPRVWQRVRTSRRRFLPHSLPRVGSSAARRHIPPAKKRNEMVQRGSTT